MSTATILSGPLSWYRAANEGVSTDTFRDGELVPETPYRVCSLLARGGMGQLFEVENESLGRRCVLKTVHPGEAAVSTAPARLRQEANILASLPASIAPIVFDLRELPDGRPYFVMERLEGGDLRKELRRFEELSVRAAIRIVLKLLAALSVVHDSGIVHRDVKLENVFLTSGGELKLLDFGAAFRDDSTLRKTGCGVAIGTRRTMAPEQHQALDTDARTDLYGVGLVLYELVVGSGPFDEFRGNETTLALAHLHLPPPAPSARAKQPLSPAVERVILKALEKRPADRYWSAGEMAVALERAGLGWDDADEPTDIDMWLEPA
ncbi:MAG: serine/threonine protein kinase [Polyangiaceae bacterium]|nr:serine/threonine protein kinase [Polyangiaceae bacterium]